ncbi:MAG TPA: HAD-IC family P-type ATPase, partial [Candidatus Nanoarchaeia archaeon]|nr:HAD-IC family P-type ATPase [Candidatus Nanoarchaeia archaeon]
MDWFLKREGEVLQSLGVSRHGLLLHDVEKRFAEFGPNELQQSHGSSVGKIFFSQVKSPVVYVLIAALVVAFFLREWVDASVILVILVLNTLLGFFQEFKADRALEKLKELSSPVCRVLRDGKEVEVAAKLLVPGDIILLEAGMRVPADAYLLESWNVKVDESILTGESVPVKKSLGALSTIVPVAGRYNMVFASSVVTYGRGTAVVVETGMHTEVGKIAHLLETAEEKETPLQKKLGMLGKQLALLTVVVVVIVFVAGLLRGEPLGMMFLVAVSLAVAAIPEGLPAVVTISLSLGVKRMVRRNVLVRKLSSVETLGATTIICTDKTGTLTCNQMTVKRLFVNNGFVAVSGDGYVPVGSFLVDDKQVASSSFAQLLKVGLWCNDAKIVDGKVLGDPTEAALVVVAQKGGVTVVDARVDEVPFTSEAKFMATKYKEGKGFVWMVKGAPEVVLRKCSRVLVNGRVVKLSAGQRSSVLLANESMAHDALRVLAFAYGSSVDDLILVGLMGMVDPPRPTVTDAVARCKSAGIRVVMITGDHRLTAQAIARQIGLRDRCLTGEELDALDDASLQKIAVDVDIFARVSPEHKVRILELLRPGQVVAMTGDGVNDAPALKRADIGVAVGSATDVAKEAADMVLLDDDFSSLVVAVEEGRAIYDNIKKFVNYLLSSN